MESSGNDLLQGRARRVDAARNEQVVIRAAAAVFLSSGVDAPIRQIATKAGVGLATLYRHFPTRTDLIVAVYRRQLDECAAAGPRLLAESESPAAALEEWVALFVDFVVTKHGLAGALGSDDATFAGLHEHFLSRVLPVCGELLDAAAAAGEIETGIAPYGLLRAIGNLCIGYGTDTRYDPRAQIRFLLRGMRQDPETAGHDQ